MEHKFLPVTGEEVEKRGWSSPDFIIISGDAYVDHPSFGVAIIARMLEAYRFKVAIIAQPDWKNVDEFKKLGKPALGFLVTAGNIDSMVTTTLQPKNGEGLMLILPAEKQACARIALLLYMPRKRGRLSRICRLFWGELKPACAAWHIMITGTTACAAPFCLMPKLTC